MGTRADFYVGKGPTAEWIGSIAWDGYRDGIEDEILNSHAEAEYRDLVAAFIAGRDDGTKPEQGWPWPWETSATTDCHYWFFDGRVWDGRCSESAGEVYVPTDEAEPECGPDDDEEAIIAKWLDGREPINFPDMSQAKQRAKFGAHSGIMVIQARGSG